MSTTRYFLDTEFIEDGVTIDLISIGIKCSDGRTLYKVNTDAKLERASDWVKKNVLPHLPPPGHPAWASHEQIADAVREFVRIDGDRIEFWGYYSDYDWVVFCQLFGIMMELPKGFPKFCMDLKQWSVQLGSPRHPAQRTTEHHALADAEWNEELYHFLDSVSDRSKS